MLLVAFVAMSLASCSSGPRTVVVKAPRLQPGPNHDTPQAAVAGYLTGQSLRDAKMVCDYVAPSQNHLCNYLNAHPKYSLGNWSIGNSVVRGNEAIVSVLSDRWCIFIKCIKNDDPNTGLPQNAHDFTRAFDITPNAVPVVSVEKIKGQWYVVLA